MSKNKKLTMISMFLLTMIICLSCAFALCFSSDHIAFATDMPDFSVEAYTDSDYLLTETGSLSGRTIRDFAKDVKKASNYEKNI